MKKKIIAIILAVLSLLVIFTACGKKTTCFMCGEEKKCETRVVMGDTIDICRDCLDELDEFRE